MIRVGTIKDAEKISNLKIQNYLKTYKGIFDDSYLKNLSIKDEKSKYIRHFQDRKILVYEKDNKILGYIYYGKRKNNINELTEYNAEIYAIYVDINFIDSGIGTKLIKHALMDLIKDYDKVILWCAKENIKAQKFYLKNNFVKSNIISNSIGGKNVTEIAFIFDFTNPANYKLTRFTSFIEKSNIIAVYSNFNMFFLKENTSLWFKQIVDKDLSSEIPLSFYNYLINKEVIELA